MHRIPRILTAVSLGLAIGAGRAPAQQNPSQPSAAGTVITPDELLDNALRLIDSGDYKEAAAITDRVYRLKPDHPRLKLIQALFLIESKRSAEALQILSEYNDSEDGKKDYRGFAAVGTIYKKSYAFTTAVRPLELAKTFAPVEANGKPVKAQITIELASVLQKLKRTKEAMTALKEAESLAPNDAGVQMHLGEVSLEAQEYDAALRFADRSIELTMGQLRSDPFKRTEHDLLKQTNELKIKVARSQSAAKPEEGKPYFTLAEATDALGEAERRISLLDARDSALQALSKDPKQHNWRVFLARIELELGGVQDAIDHVNEVLKEDPQNAAALQFRSEIQAKMKAAGSN